jgi:L-threonylcarbamoyladenylate synthase
MRVLRIKRRPQRKGLILIAAHFHQVARYLQPRTPSEQAALRNTGNAAVTYLMPTRRSTPRWLRGAHDTLAVRLTGHRQAANLCRSLDSALVSTSANRSGQQPARSYAQCRRYFGSGVLVLPGRVGKARKPSTISAWADGKIVRN